ncbi:MAG TPA: hypothetical protein PKH69_00790 [Thiobacillaceae bacterium]|nr:hypothetical protein [Thiobacillaceae bacterium]
MGDIGIGKPRMRRVADQQNPPQIVLALQKKFARIFASVIRDQRIS